LLTDAGFTPTALTSFSRAAGSLAPVSSNNLRCVVFGVRVGGGGEGTHLGQ
jgi:hypothetical protein